MSPAITPLPLRFFALFAVSALLSAALLVSAKPNKAEMRDMQRDMGDDVGGGKYSKRDDFGGNGGGRPSPADVQARAMAKLRERFGVKDDEEWDIISERIAKVEELRRTLWTGSAGARGAPLIAEKGKSKSKSGVSGNREKDALKSALSDKLPDAEIESRLTRAREVYRQNEFRLAKAQADLRAVLTVRQEAEAVVVALLPP